MDDHTRDTPGSSAPGPEDQEEDIVDKQEDHREEEKTGTVLREDEAAGQQVEKDERKTNEAVAGDPVLRIKILYFYYYFVRM